MPATLARATFVAQSDGRIASVNVARPSAPEATIQSAILDLELAPGPYKLSMEFFASASTSVALATATVGVLLEKDGTLRNADETPLGSIAYGSHITGLNVTVGTVEAGASVDPIVTAITASGIAALTPGSVRFSVTDGVAFLRVEPDGHLSGTSPGTATVTATADGVVSAPLTVTVLPAPLVARVFHLPCLELVADPVSGTLWAPLGRLNANPNAVVSINPATGDVGTPIALAGTPSAVAISDDGTTLYAALPSLGAYQRVDLAASAAGPVYTLPPNGLDPDFYPLSLAVQPGHPGTVALSRLSQFPGDNGEDGPYVYDDGVRRPNGQPLAVGSRLLWSSPDRLLTSPDFDTHGISELAVDAQGLTKLGTFRFDAPFNTILLQAGDRLYGDNGLVLDAVSVTKMGTFPLPAVDSQDTNIGPAIDLAARRVYFVRSFGSQGTVHLLAFDLDTYALLADRRISGVSTRLANSLSPARLVSLPNHRLALHLLDQIALLNLPNPL